MLGAKLLAYNRSYFSKSKTTKLLIDSSDWLVLFRETSKKYFHPDSKTKTLEARGEAQ